MNRYTEFFRFEGFTFIDNEIHSMKCVYPNGLVAYYKLGDYEIYDESASVRLPKMEVGYHYRALLNDNKVVAVQRNNRKTKFNSVFRKVWSIKQSNLFL